MNRKTTPALQLARAAKASSNGTHFLTMGLGVGAIGVAGAALGAVCPFCVVATPALLGWGVLQKLRGLVLSRRAAPGAGERLAPTPTSPEETP